MNDIHSELFISGFMYSIKGWCLYAYEFLWRIREIKQHGGEQSREIGGRTLKKLCMVKYFRTHIAQCHHTNVFRACHSIWHTENRQKGTNAHARKIGSLLTLDSMPLHIDCYSFLFSFFFIYRDGKRFSQ